MTMTINSSSTMTMTINSSSIITMTINSSNIMTMIRSIATNSIIRKEINNNITVTINYCYTMAINGTTAINRIIIKKKLFYDNK